MSKIKVHPVAALFPMIGESELQALTQDIAEHGQRDAITMHDGVLIDGRNRLAACERAGVEPRFEEWAQAEGDTVEAWIISRNVHRRHLDESQRGIAAAGFAEYMRKQHQRAAGTAESFQKMAARVFNVSERTVQHAEKVLRDGAKELQDAVRAGKASVSAAAKTTALPKDEQAKAAQQGKAAVSAAAKQASRDVPPQSANLRMDDTEPEQAAPAATDRVAEDADGNEIPAALRELWATLNRLAPEAAQSLRAAFRAVQALTAEAREAGPSGRVSLPKTASKELLNLLRPLQRAAETCDRVRPYRLCPACEGSGCAKCHSTGWQSRTTAKETARADAKGKAALAGSRS